DLQEGTGTSFQLGAKLRSARARAHTERGEAGRRLGVDGMTRAKSSRGAQLLLWCLTFAGAALLASALVRSAGAAGTTPSTTTLSSSANPSVFGQSVLFTATVNGSLGTPTGSVAFKD